MPTILVHSGDDLQAAMDAAVAGDVLVLDDAATFTGNFVLRAKAGSSPITIQGVTVPTVDVRVSPGGATNFPKIQPAAGGSPGFLTEDGAHDWTLIGLELKSTPTGANDILRLGDGSNAQNSLAQVPYNLVVDRCYIHGHASLGQKRGIALNSGNTTIKNCYISDCFWSGQDSQAIGGWNGTGPYLIDNNYLEASGENFLLGGADTAIVNNIPSDVTFTNNHCKKPLAWRGLGYVVKCLLELKTGRRVVIDQNTFENNWGGEGQSGSAILFTVRNQDETNPWNTIEDVEFTRNIVMHSGGAINVLGHEDRSGVVSGTLSGLNIHDNVLYDISGGAYSGDGRFIMLQYGDDIEITHNTAITDGYATMYLVNHPVTNLTVRDNILVQTGQAVMTANDDVDLNGLSGTAALVAMATPYVFTSNVIVGGSGTGYPSGNFYPVDIAAVQFTNVGTNDYTLAGGSPYNNAASDGADMGARFVLAPPPSSPPTAPANPTPPTTSTGVSQAPTLSWAAVADASSYDVKFGLTGSPSVVSSNQASTAYVPGTLSLSTVYYWQVIAHTGGGDVAGPVWSFTTSSTPVTTPTPTPVTTLTASATFNVIPATVALVDLDIPVLPTLPVGYGTGFLVHPELGRFDYEVKPDQWVNIDGDVIVRPIWGSARTITSASNVLWDGNIADSVCEERWLALGGLAMPVTMLRMLLMIFTNPVDPASGYVKWFPNYTSPYGFNVLVLDVSMGGELVLDDVVNHKDGYGNPDGWVTSPVTVRFKIVGHV